jgi:dienelactone hydrolase
MQPLFLALLTLFIAIPAIGGQNVIYQVDGKDYEGYVVNGGKKAPTVLLIHDWDGLTDYEVKRAEMLGQLGYSVFAADLYGAGDRPATLEDKKKHTQDLYGNRTLMRTLLYGALKAAQEQGLNTGDAVAMGYCFGGAAVLEFARSGAPMKGFVTFHGGLATPEGQDYSAAKGSFLILHGTADTSVTMDDFAALAKQLEAAGLKHEMITYSGAPHAFTVFDTDRYREDADKKSWARFTQFLTEIL